MSTTETNHDCESGWTGSCKAGEFRKEISRLSSEGGRKTDLIKLLIKECGEMEFDHTNACMNWAACEHSQIECALCQLREAVSGKQSDE